MTKVFRFTAATALLLALSTAAFSQPPELQYNFARELFLNSNYSIAEAVFSSYAAARPEDPVSGEAKFFAGESLYASGRYREALDSYVAVIEAYQPAKNKFRKELYYRAAECYYQVKDYENSIRYINILLKEFPDSYLTGDAYLLLGENYFLTSRYDDSAEALNRMENYTNYKHFDYVYYLKGRVYYEKSLAAEDVREKEKNAEEAIRYFERVKTEFPDSPVINHAEFRKANVWYSLGKYDTSIKVISGLIEGEKEAKFRMLMKYFLAWNYYMSNHPKKAMKLYDRIITECPGDLLTTWSEYKKGLCLEAVGDRKGALDQYNKVMEKYPETLPSAYSRYAVAQVYYGEKKYQDALYLFEEVAARYNIEELTRAADFMSADIYVLMDKPGKAREIYGRIEAANDKDRFTAAYMSAWCLFKEASFEESTKKYEALIADPKTPADLRAKSMVKTGDNLYEQGRLDEARARYSEAAEKYPGLGEVMAEALYGMGWIAYSKNDYKGARPLFEKSKAAAGKKEAKLRADFMKANTLYADYSFDAALDIYTAIMNDRAAPASMREDSVFYAGWCWYRKEKFETAAGMWNRYKAMVSDPVKKAEASYRTGWAFFRRNDFDAAIREFGDILENYKQTHFYQEALLKTGDSYYNKKDYNRAIELYRSLVDSFPDHYRVGEALYGIQWSYYALGENEKAIEVSRQFLDKYPESSFAPEIQYRVAEHYFNSSNFETAAGEFSKFIEKNPKDPMADNAYYWLGSSRLSLKDYAGAITAFKELNAKYPDNQFAERALFKAAGAHYQLRDYPSAVETYLQFTEKYGQSKYMPEACFNLAMSYKRAGNIEKTELWYKKLIEAYPDSALYERAMMNLGYLYQDNKEYDRAIEIFRKVADTGRGKAVEAQFWIADCYSAKKDNDRAAKEYLKVYENYGGEELWAVSALDAAGKIYEKKGDLKSSIKMYRLVLKATKQEKYTATAKKRIELLEEQYKLLNPATEGSKPAAK
ncbi:MAG: tetratricopeptide repeat protein [Spirochaetia bacterium]|nr:tetratricopeptide repeat protein [Spirochaetia bacterium]